MSGQAETSNDQPAYAELRQIGAQCGTANWDGDGAEAIEAETLRHVHCFLKALPSGFPMPVLSAEPDGQVELEWYRATDCLLSVSVSRDGVLYYAALVGEGDPRGRCRFDGAVPETILYWIQRVCAP